MGGRRLIFRSLLAGLLGLAGSAWAQQAAGPAAPLTITWLVMEMPPHFSYPNHQPPHSPGELGPHGEIDGLQRLLIAQMPPEIHHIFIEAGLSRFEALARQGDAVCSMFHVKTPERLQWMYFTSLMPPMDSRDLHVVVRGDALRRFTEHGQAVQLAELLRRPDLVGLLPRGRAYGPRIDGLLQAAGDAGPKDVTTGRVAHLLPMLRAGRMDYTLEYPSVVAEYLRENPNGPALVELPIVEGRSTNVATASCARSPAGRRAIEAIDLAVRRLAQSPQRDALIRVWRGPLGENDRERLSRYMDERARGGAQIE
jgi:uncharacterized protein (TIGR02285 family)